MRTVMQKFTALMAVSLLLGACGTAVTDGGTTVGRGDNDLVSNEATVLSSADATETTNAEIAETASDETDATGLGSIMLRVSDLPDGWTELRTGSDDEGDGCLDALFGAGRPFDPAVGQVANFGASSNGPFLMAWVVGEPADDVLVEVNDVLIACDGSTAPSGFTTTIDPTPVPGLPTNSLSVHGDDTNAGGVRISYTLAGSGTDVATVMVFAATPLGEIDDAMIASAVTAMVGRFPG